MLLCCCCCGGGGTADRSVGVAADSAASKAGSSGDGWPVGKTVGISLDGGMMNELLSVGGAEMKNTVLLFCKQYLKKKYLWWQQVASFVRPVPIHFRLVDGVDQTKQETA